MGYELPLWEVTLFYVILSHNLVPQITTNLYRVSWARTVTLPPLLGECVGAHMCGCNQGA